MIILSSIPLPNGNTLARRHWLPVGKTGCASIRSTLPRSTPSTIPAHRTPDWESALLSSCQISWKASAGCISIRFVNRMLTLWRKRWRQWRKKFGNYLGQMKWINFGGGHHITREGYDLALLKKCIRHMQDYGLRVYIEPGEAVALQTGFLVSTVLEIIPREPAIAILDTSAACHMPDVIEMPYRPPVVGSGRRERPIPIGWPDPPAWPGTILALIPLTSRCGWGTGDSLGIWLSIPW